ncbi:hypothetical protein B0H10DRAFT_259094 [Mycena sp. CBHHK59/15]|nr:hypothetical protein B0H10DRAFT_259094 [Mycena sp. CBHHK59/15]
MTKPKNNNLWEAAVEAYDHPEFSKKKKKNATAAPAGLVGQREASKGSRGRRREEKIRVSNPDIQRHHPYIRKQPGGPSSTLSNRSKAAQDKLLPAAFEHRLRAAFPLIPTYRSPLTLAELKSRAKSAKELERVVPIVRRLVEEGRVISCSTRLVDPHTGQTLFLYLGDRYGDNSVQYVNHEGLGDSRKSFVKPKDLEQATARKYLVKGVQAAKQKGYNIVQDGFHENIIDAYGKAVHAMAFVNTPNRDQTTMRHGPLAENGTSVHSFPIAPEVKWTSKPAEAGLRNTQVSDPGQVYSDKPGEGCEPSGVWHFIEGREQIGHHGQGLYMAKDMCPSSGSTTAVGAMYKNMETLESNVEAIVKVAFPGKYQEMKGIWRAGKIWERQSGCHNARAIVFKLPVFPHWDDTDFGVSVSFAAGRFTGGYLYIPQFELVFEYRPGTMAAFYADCTIHSVGDWEAVRMEKNDEMTPGRIGTVFYIPQSSAEALGDKEPGWGLKTNYGRFPA